MNEYVITSGEAFEELIDKYKMPREEKEFIFLTVVDTNGALVCSDEILHPTTTAVAVVDLSTGEMHEGKGVLHWLIKDDNGRGRGWGFDFFSNNIYHIRGYAVFGEKPKGYLYNIVVSDVIDDGLSDPRLDKLLEKYKKPVFIDDPELGRFDLDRQYSWFEGEIDWLGEKKSVTLGTDCVDGDTASKALEHLRTLAADIPGWDDRFRRYVAKENIDMVNEWELRDEPFTEEELMEMLSFSDLAIEEDGSIRIYYFEEGDLFGGHAFELDANINGDFSGTDFVG